MLDFVNKLGKVAVIVISSVSVLVFIALTFFILTWGHVEMGSSYKDITLTDRPLTISKLNTLGINYETHEGEIFIDSDAIRKTRMLLAAEGLSNNASIVGYEVFNKSEALGTSSFAQNVNLLRALEGELSRTIMSFDSIQSARVHLVISQKIKQTKSIYCVEGACGLYIK